ncbi:S-adenosylmethionine-dependent methyltransferase [Desulfosporosinus fructosivorans]|uniref:S-adenosylmethionine-dependent methyltransferase n=1 Tax=Desulfosporosinus fructosivorans TaxID=2018669 RepID=A0A4Z0R0C1_9FIRM|nr:SAM-dependent methyltransferase [Desulfosporosinus fructosivorans]TGE35785.1 S-adenosylmethionine-dependent methyltransferase [Desulfosporosinus fructosivorans]
MKQFAVNPIGKIETSEAGMLIEVTTQYIPALKELDGFSHVNVLWWFDGNDNNESRSVLEVPAPYKKSPLSMGIFATRSPFRPNPIALTVAQILYIDHAKGTIAIAYIDANEGSPVIDLKPYTPSLDRVEAPRVPEWCGHWPKSLEDSGSFNWENEFNY